MSEVKLFGHTGDFAENKDTARDLRLSSIAPEITKGKTVILDFENVTSATQSFIHALISQIIRDFGSEVLLTKLQFKNCNSKIRPVIEVVVEYVQDGIYTDPEE